MENENVEVEGTEGTEVQETETQKRIDHKQLIAACLEKNVELEEMEGHFKAKGKNGRRLYIPRQGTVKTVDVAGWEPEGVEGIEFYDADKRPSKATASRLDLSVGGLAAFRLLLDVLDQDTTIETKKKGTSEPKPTLAGTIAALEADKA